MAVPNAYGDNDSQGAGPETPEVTTEDMLLDFIVPRVKRARDVRDEKFKRRWDEYTRLWRGFWSSEDKSNASERSKLIAPALSQAIEMTAAEIEEATFGRKAWLDITDDIADENKDDALQYRDQLLEDFELAGVPDSCSECFLLGAIYGTGIAKINLRPSGIPTIGEGGVVQADDRILVTVDPIRPDEFVIDPAATKLNDALFCAHEFIKPIHTVRAKMKAGIYRTVDVQPYTGQRTANTTGTGQNTSVVAMDEGCLITEYYGKVPAKLVGGKGEQLVEALVTIVNEGEILRAKKNPYKMQDRPIVAYQHDKVPGEFWGRGVAEKGYNPQKALDGELRARIDALALLTAPMMGADITRLPRDPDMRVRPGKIFMTRGRPSEILEPLGFDPRGLAATFQQSGDLERMVQMGTGSMDSATPIGVNSRNETASGMSMLQTGFLKRTKRTMQNIERQFIDPLVTKCLWRYMQYEPERYPNDMKFVVNATMGIMAKEVESAQLTQMLGYAPPESPGHNLILSALFDNTVSSEKAKLKAAIDAILQPPSPEDQQMQAQMKQIQFQMAVAELQEAQGKAAKAMADAKLAQAKTLLTMVQADLADDEVEIEAAYAAIAAEQVRGKSEESKAKVQIAKHGVEKERLSVKKAEHSVRKSEADAKKPKPTAKKK